MFLQGKDLALNSVKADAPMNPQNYFGNPSLGVLSLEEERDRLGKFRANKLRFTSFS